MLPSGAMNGGGIRGTKNPGTPSVTADAALTKFKIGRIGSMYSGGMNGVRADTRSQNSRKRSMRRSGAWPAINAALIAPIDTPEIQSGATPARLRGRP